MDSEPIMYPRFEPIIANVRPICLGRKFSWAIESDNIDTFMRVIKNPRQLKKSVGPQNWKPIIEIFREDALEIAKAVFNGETKGLIDPKDVFKDGYTPLHLAADVSAPRLINYFLQKGYKADAVLSDHHKFDLNHSNPLDLSISSIFVPEEVSPFSLLWWLCYRNRREMEAIRVLVQSNEDKTWARHACLKYARKGELSKLAALILAVPEQFSQSFLSKLPLELENKTLDKELSLLVDVFAFVGHQLAAYLRLEEFNLKSRADEVFMRVRLEIDFFLREVASKKLGVPSPDYYLSFFEVRVDESSYIPEWNVEEDGPLPDLDECFAAVPGAKRYDLVPHFVTREDVDRNRLYSLIPSLERLERLDADWLATLIEKKVSSVSSHSSREKIAKPSEKAKPPMKKIAKPSEKPKPPMDMHKPWLIVPPPRPDRRVGAIHTSVDSPILKPRAFHTRAGSAIPMSRSFHTSASCANPMFGVKFSATKNLENKVMQSSKLKSLFEFVKLSQFPLIAKRLLK